MAMDRFLEYIVEHNKEHQSRSHQGGKEYLINAISPNILCYKAAKDAVFRSSKAPDPGSKHSKVETKMDVLRLVEIFTSSKLLRYEANRVGFGSNIEFQNQQDYRYAEAPDLIVEGHRRLSTPGRFMKVVEQVRAIFPDEEIDVFNNIDQYHGEAPAEYGEVTEDMDDGEESDYGIEQYLDEVSTDSGSDSSTAGD